MKSILFLVVSLAIVSCIKEDTVQDHLNLSQKLSGSWKTTAFSGELHETWQLERNGWMEQQGYYIEKTDTSYSAKTRIEKIGADIILFSIIKNSDPKIFKAIKSSENEIIFENKDYKNPFQVKYQFIDSNNYKRTITGYEHDSLVVYEFKFEKQLDQ